MDRGDTKPPEKFQYTGDICHILFRSQGPLLIPRTILKKCPKLAVRLDKKHIFSKPLDTVDIEDYPFSTFDKENSQIYQSAFETGVREKMARETLAKTILETWEAGGGSLSSL
ncbi:hypothetical protein DER46DRAFT_662485 [Fusarium sp. MPI-SDFR-AT-0072]|nr:hypothetical protein DER46DRAFT_662485 [Fusarium sp. MPI-SDFR-AT-0072]